MAVKLDRVLIIGGGIGGLSTAIALQRMGIHVSVVEQADTFGDVGAGLTLWANAIKALEKLGVPESALNGERICRAVSMDWRGNLLTTIDMREMEKALGAPSIAVHRADVHRALLAALPEGTVQTGRIFTGFDQDAEGVTASFADGRTERADLLVGADGIRSTVRKQLFPQVGLRYAGYAAWRGVVDYPPAAVHEQTSETWGRGARFGIVPIGGTSIYWFATANLPSGLQFSPAERKVDLRERFKDWHQPVEALIESTPDDKILYNDIYDFRPMIHWTTGRVTLLGDAAHATTPNMGQGACQAIESSLVLARCLAETDSLPAALSQYEAIRQPRTAWITAQSWVFGAVAQNENPLVVAARDWAARKTPLSFTRNQLIKVAGYEV